MMKILTIEEIKSHIRIDGNEEDSTLEMYGESAEQTVLNLLNRSEESLLEEYGEVPTPVKHAMLMLTAHSYDQRNPASERNLYTVPYTLDALIKPYMIL